jgi:hypothetical protein
MYNKKEIRKRLDSVREQLLELESEFQNGQKIASSQFNEQEIRKRLDDVREQVAELEKEIQYPPTIAASQYEEVPQIAPQPGLSLTEDQVYFANAIVQQASRRIHDLRLLSATEYSAIEVEAASRRFLHRGRKSYLEATHPALQVYKVNEDS